MTERQKTLKAIETIMKNLKQVAKGSGSTAIRASHNIKELEKLSEDQRIEAYNEWQKLGEK